MAPQGAITQHRPADRSHLNFDGFLTVPSFHSNATVKNLSAYFKMLNYRILIIAQFGFCEVKLIKTQVFWRLGKCGIMEIGKVELI